MTYRPPPSMRKTSGPWDRLRPVKQDPLEAMGYVSKGDARLLEVKAQESFYNKIVARYMHFCSQHSTNLDEAFASLNLQDIPLNDVSTCSLPIKSVECRSTSSRPLQTQSTTAIPSTTLPSNEMTIILTALRKLREGLLASSATSTSPVFAQRVHVFNIRLAILAQHPESYHPSLLHLLGKLHSTEHPLPKTELHEMISYLILDLATRQDNLGAALTLRYNAHEKYAFDDRNVNLVLRSILTNNWIVFWSVRRKVDGYMRAILQYHAEKLRKAVLKVLARSYMTCDVKWILNGSTGGELEWEELVKKEQLGWIRDGNKVIIRKPKLKP